MANEAVSEKVVIVGGGLAAVSAAFALTDPAQKGRYDVSLYQIGWRLGGKGASGRNREMADRIEEHGLHVWFGCYDNAFDVMRRCYEELGRPADAPLATVDCAFKGHDACTFEEKVQGKWLAWRQPFPTNHEVSGTPPTPWVYLVHLLDWMRSALDRSGHAHGPLAAQESAQLEHERHWWQDALDELEAEHAILEKELSPAHLMKQLVDLAERLGPDVHGHKAHHHRILTFLVEVVTKAVWRAVRDRVETDDDHRHFWIYFNLAGTCAKGILADGLVSLGFDPADDDEFRAWLFRHASVPGNEAGGANHLAFWSPPVQALYDASFAYADGNNATPSLAAGTSLRITLRLIFGYKGHMVYEMQAGMGDTVFAPMYEVLKKRGVQFHFFNRVRKLELDADKKSIARVRVGVQVNLKNGGSYDPLYDVKGLPCWPSAPFYEQIEEGAELKEKGINLELYSEEWPDRREVVLEADKDFDHVVLGVTHACLPYLCEELKDASPAWEAMQETIQSVQTQAIQLWLTPTIEELGWDESPVVLGAYQQPYSSVADFTHLLKRENWPANAKIGNLTYSCGVLAAETGEEQPDANERVWKIAVDYLDNDAAPVFPNGVRADNPKGLDWSKLFAAPSLSGLDRLKAQYLRANIDPVERYVLSVPKTQRARLKAESSGFGRLTITGTWIDTGLNISAVETATMAGLQASRAISGYPAEVWGESDL